MKDFLKKFLAETSHEIYKILKKYLLEGISKEIPVGFFERNPEELLDQEGRLSSELSACTTNSIWVQFSETSHSEEKFLGSEEIFITIPVDILEINLE